MDPEVIAPILSKQGSDHPCLFTVVTINLALGDLGVKWGYGPSVLIDNDHLRFTLPNLVMVLETGSVGFVHAETLLSRHWRRLQTE